MSNTSRHKQKHSAQKPPRSTKAPRRWTLGHLMSAFFMGAVLGFLIGYESGDGSQRTDGYGRSPDDPHYSHDHP